MAVNLANEACAETKNNAPHILDTLAASYANNGDFEKAVIEQGKAVTLPGENEAFDYKLRIRLYEKKIKYRSDIDLDKALQLLQGDEKF